MGNLHEFDADFEVSLLCGVDEAGRGPLAGDVYAAAVILDPEKPIAGLNDSKKLTEKKRDGMYENIISNALYYSIASADVAEIEEINILQATFLAMKRAISGLSAQPGLTLIDGDKNPDLGVRSISVIKGDQKSACVAAASILAKTARDRYMREMDLIYPEYGFAGHKGYGTKAHKQAIIEYGSCALHRKLFLRKITGHGETKPNQSIINGNMGEDAAAQLLISKGYTILKRNCRSDFGEIDIIAQKISADGAGDVNDAPPVIVFAEVKLRKDESRGQPREAVNQSKCRKIINTAINYLKTSNQNGQPRFDVIEVYNHKGKYYLKHFTDAITADGMNIFV